MNNFNDLQEEILNIVKTNAPKLYKLYGGKIKKLIKPKKFKNMKGGKYGEYNEDGTFDYGYYTDIKPLLENPKILMIIQDLVKLDKEFISDVDVTNKYYNKRVDDMLTYNILRNQLYRIWMSNDFCKVNQYNPNSGRIERHILPLCYKKFGEYITSITPNISYYKNNLVCEAPDKSNVDTPESNLWSRPCSSVSTPVSTPGGRNILYDYYTNYTNQNGGNTELNKLTQEIINIRTGII
jgi:hypothetical protein